MPQRLKSFLLKALAGEVQNGFYFLRRHVENFRDLFDRHTSLKILEHRLNRHPRSPENPRAANLTGNAPRLGIVTNRDSPFRSPCFQGTPKDAEKPPLRHFGKPLRLALTGLRY